MPHPDDESLSTGGLLTQLRSRSVPVTVLAVTDGGAAYPGAVDADRLAAIRREEQRAALGELGVEPDAIVRLELPDGEVASSEGALERVIARLIVERSIRHVVAPWIHDHHCDHEACGRAAAIAASGSAVPVTFGLFWALHRTPDPSFGAGRLARLILSDADRDAKNAAVGCHRSQLTTDVVPSPMLGPSDLTPLARAHELFVVADRTST